MLQKPLWCEKNTTHSCQDREYYFLGELPYLTAAECIIYEVRVQYFRAQTLSIFLMCKLLMNLLLVVILKMVNTFGSICVISMLNYICYSPIIWNLNETANSTCLYRYLIYWIWMSCFRRFGCVKLLRKYFKKIRKMFSE